MKHPHIFVNLPVRDLPKSRAFFEAVGYKFNAEFSDDTAACLVVNDNIFIMLLTHGKFRMFTPKAICDAHEFSEALICLSCAGRAEVDELVRKAVAAGGSTYSSPQEHGFMYGHGFQDLDGHIWELMFLDAQTLHAN